MENIKLSVLVTFCNQAEFIKDALDSIFCQIVDFDYEVLIGLETGINFEPKDNPINEKVSDESEKIISDYVSKYKNIKLFKINTSDLKRTKIEKASLNRINLLKHARGEYFCILDGDDFYNNPYRFQTLINILDKNYDYIGAGHYFENYNNITKQSCPIKKLSEIPMEYTAVKYYSDNKSIPVWCFIFRNIFSAKLPSDLNISFFNDSTITAYMLKYGKIYYIPENMLSYRINITSIYNSKEYVIRKLYRLLCAEINHKTIPQYEKYLCRRYKKNLISLLTKKIIFTDEVKAISDCSIRHKCFFTYSIINGKNLSIKEKIRFYIKVLNYLLFNRNSEKNEVKKVYYFKARQNFGDLLNVFIIQQLMNINIKRSGKTACEIYAIGSILENLLKKLIIPPIFLKEIKILGSGFITKENSSKGKIKLNHKVEILALRGKVTKKRMEQILNKDLSHVPLGDPGLLAGELVDTSSEEKKYKAGIILHYVDINSSAKENIKIQNVKYINVSNNPIQIIKEIAQCEVIFSSAMHGLITADSMNIPNQRIKLSENIAGGDYKFDDYYSIYDFPKIEAINLNNEIITEKTVTKLINEYNKYAKARTEKIQKVKNNLKECFYLIEGGIID